MSVLDQMNAAVGYRNLWGALMPEMPTPAQSQFLQWAGIYAEQYVCRGLNRAAGKLRTMALAGTPMTADAVARYATSVMKNEALGQQCHSAATRL